MKDLDLIQNFSNKNKLMQHNKLTIFNKNSLTDTPSDNQSSIVYWANLYFNINVVNSPHHTTRAKKSDIDKFLAFFQSSLHSDNVYLWAPSVTRGFLKYLQNQKSPKTDHAYISTTINRMLATIRHFANWLNKQHPLPSGNSFTGVKLIQVEEPSWNGLTENDIMRLKSACDIRINACNKKFQNPILETAIFYILLMTGLRGSELAALNIKQYYNKGFHEVKRKGNKITKKIPLPKEAREYLDQYLDSRLNMEENDPLLVSRYNNRILTRDIARTCQRIARQASVHLPKEQELKLSPHMLRHTFLKRIADKHGIHVAQDLSGNISMKEIFRYTKPNYNEKFSIVETLYNDHVS